MSGDLNLPAFPTVFSNSSGSLVSEQGMTLRDYFAAKAMQALVANGVYNRLKDPSDEAVAKYAYDQADAMLKARQA